MRQRTGNNGTDSASGGQSHLTWPLPAHDGSVKLPILKPGRRQAVGDRGSGGGGGTGGGGNPHPLLLLHNKTCPGEASLPHPLFLAFCVWGCGLWGQGEGLHVGGRAICHPFPLSSV